MQFRFCCKAWPLMLTSLISSLLCDPSLTEPRDKRLVPGSDYTLQCISKSQRVASELKWFYKEQPNVKELWHEERTYLIIVHFTKSNEGLYECKNNGRILTSERLLLKSSTMKDQVTIYRPIGNNTSLLLFCNRLSKSKEAIWHWEIYPANRNKLMMKAHDVERGIASKFQGHFGSRLVPLVQRNFGIQFSLNISPVQFEDAGKYVCAVNDLGITYHVVTVKVNMEVSKTSNGYNCAISCSVSYTMKNISLVWTKNNGSCLETLDRKKLSTTNRENKLSLPVRSRDALHMACLVFDEQLLVAYIPLQQETLRQPSGTPSPEETTFSSTTNNMHSDRKQRNSPTWAVPFRPLDCPKKECCARIKKYKTIGSCCTQNDCKIAPIAVANTEPQSQPPSTISINKTTGEEDSMMSSASITCSVVLSSIILICAVLIFKFCKRKRSDSSDFKGSMDALAVNNCSTCPENEDQVIYTSVIQK